ncbi:hypothetical protein ACROYT_G034946 [Oculina patagonica]
MGKDIRGIERGKCACGECDDFMRSDGPACGYCGCLPTRHSKKDARSSFDSVSKNQEDGTSAVGTSASGSPEKWKDEDLGWFPNPKGEFTEFSNIILPKFFLSFWPTCPYKERFRACFVSSGLPSGIMSFERAYEIFCSYGICISNHEFRDELLDMDTGLGVIIYSYKYGRFIILNDTKLNICEFLEALHGREVEELEPESGLSVQDLSRALASMETEYDRWVAKLLVCTGKSRQGIYDLGFKPDRVVRLLRELKERFCAWENSNVAAKDMVELRLMEKKDKLERKISEIEKTMELVRGKWTDARVGDLEEQKIALKESLQNTVATLDRRSKQDEQRFNQAAKRTARRLVAEQRITKRSLGAGRKQELDSEDEEWLVKCIEDKATIHGRRHESVLYTHHRVKCRDLLNIANYRRFNQGKRLLNMDDKAYLRPETSEGAKGARQQTILQPADETRARSLPVHDFPEASVYITPSAFRFIRKETEVVKEEVTLVTKTDDSIVVVEPKAYVPTHASTWASNSMRLRWEKPTIHEPEQLNINHQYSEALRGLCARVHDCTFYFMDSTTEIDILSVTGADNCPHRKYEQLRLHSLEYQLTSARKLWEENQDIEGPEREIGDNMVNVVNCLLDCVSKAETDMKHVTGEQLQRVMKTVLDQCHEVLRRIACLRVPPVYPRLLELTDAGPGVGVSSAESRMRILEKARIHGNEKVLRIHRAREDSGQNEAERLNACIGDALCDGGSLKWQIYETLHGLSEEEVKGLSTSELDAHSKKVMEKNAWAVAEEVCLRIDDSPAPRGYDSFFDRPTRKSLFLQSRVFEGVSWGD